MQKIKFTKEEYGSLILENGKRINVVLNILKSPDAFPFIVTENVEKTVRIHMDYIKQGIEIMTKIEEAVPNATDMNTDNPLIQNHYKILTEHNEVLDKIIDTYEKYILNS